MYDDIKNTLDVEIGTKLILITTEVHLLLCKHLDIFFSFLKEEQNAYFVGCSSEYLL